MKDLLTLLVPVRDRQENLTRLFYYYEDWPCKVIIVDSSIEIFEVQMMPDNFEYHYVGPTHFLKKMARMLKIVETPYVIDHPDDDIYCREGVERCLEKLENDKEVVLCDGLFFEEEQGYFVLSTNYTSQQTNFNKEHNKDDVFERAKFYTTMVYWPRNHSVIRTNKLLEFFDVFSRQNDLFSFSLYDKMFLLYMASVGKFEFVDKMFCIKDHTTEKRLVSRDDIQKEWQGIKLEWNNFDKIAKRMGFISSLTQHQRQYLLEYCFREINRKNVDLEIFTHFRKTLQQYLSAEKNIDEVSWIKHYYGAFNE